LSEIGGVAEASHSPSFRRGRATRSVASLTRLILSSPRPRSWRSSWNGGKGGIGSRRRGQRACGDGAGEGALMSVQVHARPLPGTRRGWLLAGSGEAPACRKSTGTSQRKGAPWRADTSPSQTLPPFRVALTDAYSPSRASAPLADACPFRDAPCGRLPFRVAPRRRVPPLHVALSRRLPFLRRPLAPPGRFLPFALPSYRRASPSR
jgi:hypothetical protein